MESTLHAIESHSRLSLQIVATGMHLDRSRGRTLNTIRSAGWHVDATVAWPAPIDPNDNGAQTGRAIAGLSRTFERLDPNIVLVVGDRVEAFAAATAAHLAGRIVAHVHGGDRALGQVDDALRHAITKLAHLHFPATRRSAARIIRLGEDRWRVYRTGSPGVDGIREVASTGPLESNFPGLRPGCFALLLLHPTDGDPAREQRRAAVVLRAALASGVNHIVVVYPNTDPGAAGIVRKWETVEAAKPPTILFRRDIPRPLFLALLRDAAVLVGNSSSGIIEAASFGTPVIDIGPRQSGRERSRNVTSVPFDHSAIVQALNRCLTANPQRRSRPANVYEAGSMGAGQRIADVLATVTLDRRLSRKLIAY